MPTWVEITLSLILTVIVVNLLWGLIPRRAVKGAERREPSSRVLRVFAESNGWSFEAEPEHSPLEDIADSQVARDTECCGEPARVDRVVRNLTERQDKEFAVRGMDCAQCFLYVHKAGSSERQQTIAVFTSPKLDLPRMHAVLVPSSWLGKRAGRWILRHWSSQEAHWKDW